MHVELQILGLGCLLLVVHLLATIHLKTRQYGRDWNIGARDEPLPPLNPDAARLERAQANFLETFPIAIVALAGVVIADKTSGVTALFGWLWLVGRAAYLPLYWSGVKGWRTAVWTLSTLSILVVVAVLLFV